MSDAPFEKASTLTLPPLRPKSPAVALLRDFWIGMNLFTFSTWSVFIILDWLNI